MVYFYDPAGNILELVARHTLDNASSAPFRAHSLGAVSELGVAVPKVRPALEVLSRKTQAQVYLPERYLDDSQPSFVPLGDEEGLLVVVQEGRNWFPDTGQAALAVPFGVGLENGLELGPADLF